jgi:hypothetical protein
MNPLIENLDSTESSLYDCLYPILGRDLSPIVLMYLIDPMRKFVVYTCEVLVLMKGSSVYCKDYAILFLPGREAAFFWAEMTLKHYNYVPIIENNELFYFNESEHKWKVNAIQIK